MYVVLDETTEFAAPRWPSCAATRPTSTAWRSAPTVLSRLLPPATARYASGTHLRLRSGPRLAGASVAGHLIECGAQATGALWHRWEEVPDLAGIGYPIAEIASDGSAVITKPDGSGGLVT